MRSLGWDLISMTGALIKEEDKNTHTEGGGHVNGGH